jgi:hypothetical protein
MLDPAIHPDSSPDHVVRNFVFSRVAATAELPQPQRISDELAMALDDVNATLRRLAEAKVLIMAPNGGDIWAANPFCAVPSGISVEANARRYWAICAWDALGIVAALRASTASIHAPCGDCGEMLHLRIEDGAVAHSESVIHFAVPARQWWRNIGFA